MPRPCGGAVKDDEPTTFQDAVHDSLCQVLIVEDLAPIREGRLVGREYDGSPEYVPVVHHMEQDIGGVRAIVQVIDLVNHPDSRRGIGLQRLAELSLVSMAVEFYIVLADEKCRERSCQNAAIMSPQIARRGDPLGAGTRTLEVQAQSFGCCPGIYSYNRWFPPHYR